LAVSLLEVTFDRKSLCFASKDYFKWNPLPFYFSCRSDNLSCTCSFHTESMLRMRCRRKVLNQQLHVS